MYDTDTDEAVMRQQSDAIAIVSLGDSREGISHMTLDLLTFVILSPFTA